MSSLDPSMEANVLRWLPGWAAILLLTAGTVAQLATPTPAPADAPADQFSATRAYRHVRVLGSHVHQVGSVAQDTNRRYIIDQLATDGIDATVQRGVGASTSLGAGSQLAEVSNVVARIPGRHPTGQVILVAHTDSVRVGPGGSDDGAGTAALLETARALMRGGRPDNDVVLVFTDGEEACLCGAAAYVAAHRDQARDSVVLNLEARGGGGPVVMFETSRNNAALVRQFGAHAPYPVGTSFAVEIYRRLPNDTDFTLFREAGFAGLNSAYIDDSAVYHTPQDTPAAMDRGSLQQHGANALALTRAFGSVDLRRQTASGDDTYFPVLGLLVRYPGALVWPLAALAALAVAAAVALARRRRLVTLPRVAGGFGLAVLPIAVSAVLAQLGWALLGWIRPGYAGMLTGDPYHPGLLRLAVVLLAACVLALWYVLLRRRIGGVALALAGLSWLALLGLVLAALVPGGSYLAALPALFAAGGLLVALRWPVAAPVAFPLGAAPAVLILAPTVALLFPALGLATGAAGALLVVLAGFALVPLLALTLRGRTAGPVADTIASPAPTADRAEPVTVRRGWRRPVLLPAVLLVSTLVAGVLGVATSGFDARHPEPAHLTYALDADTGRAIWASSQPGEADRGAAQRWLSHFVGTGTEQVGDRFPVLGGRADGRMRTGKAPAADVPAPTLTALSAGRPDADGYATLRLRLRSARGAPILGLYLPHGAAVRSVRVQGKPVRTTADGRWALAVTFYAAPTNGITVQLTLKGSVRARILDESDGLSGLPGYRPRPADVSPAAAHDADEAVVARTVPVSTRPR
ncbi:M28 family peptidase [Actinocatenispora sera]|nr:M28 family peptidase [Actinocatenispora sera]